MHTTYAARNPAPLVRTVHSHRWLASVDAMVGGLVAAGLSAVLYGVASVFQAIAARRTAPAEGVDPRVLFRVVGQPWFLAGLMADGAGFVAQFWALRTLPIFVVQSALAASLAVTAVVAVPLLGLILTARQWAAVGGVCVGLVLLGLSAGVENAHVPSLTFQFALLGAVAALALAGAAANRLPGPGRAVSLGLVAGLSFGVTAIAARSLGDLSPARLVREPAAYAVVAAGVVAFLYYTIGLQRAAVTTVTAALVIGETVLPSLVGVLVFDDGTRPGFLPVAVVGFVLAVACSLALARFGEVGSEAPARI
jgi:drug/metabolite transporter (DMT)-like permease